MKFGTTLLLLAVVAILGGLVWYQGRGDEDPAQRPQETLLGDFQSDIVSRIDVELLTREPMALEVREREWWIVDPVLDRAKQDSVDNLIQILLGNPRDLVEKGGASNLEQLKKLGLEPPLGRITLTGDGGKKSLRLRIGERDPAQQYVYVLIEGDSAIYRTGANLANLLERHRQNWRSTRLTDGDGALVRKLELVRPGQPKVVVERKSGVEWAVTEPFAYPGDDGLIGRLVNGLLLLEVVNFPRNSPDEKTIVELNLGDTATVATLDFGQRRVELRFGTRQGAGPGSKRTATDSERKHAFVVSGAALDLLDTPEAAFRDRRVVRFAPGDVTRVRLDRAGTTSFELVYRPGERRFYYTQPFARACDDSRSSQLRAWLGSLASLEVSNILDSKEFPAVEQGVDPWQALGFDDLSYAIEIETASTVAEGKPIRIEVARTDDGAGECVLRRLDRFQDVAYFVPAARMHAIGTVDLRVFVDRRLLPDDLENFERVTIRRGGVVRTIQRTGTGSSRTWTDPTDSKKNLSDIQAYVYRLKGLTVDRVLGRDAEAADGVQSGAEHASIEVQFGGARASDPPIAIRVGTKDASGKLVRVASESLPRNAIAEAEVWLRDELDALFP